MRGGHTHCRVGHRQQIRCVGGPVRPAVVLLDDLGALVGRVGGQGCGGLAAEVVLRVADRDPRHPRRVRGIGRVCGPAPKRRVDDLATLAVPEHRDRGAVVRQCRDVLDKPVRAHLVESLAEWQGEVVDGLAVVRGIAQLATELHLGERDHVLQPDQPALEGENGRRQPHLRRRRGGAGVRRRRRPDQGGRQSDRQTGPQQRLHITLRDCSAKSCFLPQQSLHTISNWLFRSFGNGLAKAAAKPGSPATTPR